MKLRIKDNNVRIRMSQDEVSKLVEDKEVWAISHIGNSVLKYGVKAFQGNTLEPNFGEKRIWLSVPEAWLEHWDKDDRVGFKHTMGDAIILLEKDFQCLVERTDEDESDLFPNPNDKHC